MSGMKDLFGDEPYEQRKPSRLAEAKLERDIGMERAVDHANRTYDTWDDTAYDFLVRFAQTNLRFISEDVSGASKLDESFPQPPTDRAWGKVYTRAIKARIIMMEGTGRSSRRHASICPRWRSLVYRGRL